MDVALVAACGSAELLRARGAALVVDGLDEVDSGDADGISQDARIHLAGSPRSSVLLTVRPGVLSPRDDDILSRGLDDADLEAVLRSLGVDPRVSHSWSPQLMDSVRRPFFALAAASALVGGVTVSSQAGLIKHLVEQALNRGTTQSILSRREVFDGLVQLAVDLTSNGVASRNFQQEAETLSTRLVMKIPGAKLQFALPIFEQWFAAQYLLASQEGLSSVLRDGRTFDRWRWAVAIVLTDAPPSTTDSMMSSLMAFNPGAASWVIDQVAKPRRVPLIRDGRQSAIEEDFATSSRRLKGATRALIDAIGPLGPLTFDLSESGHFEFGMKVSANGALERGWRRRDVVKDSVVPLPTTWDDATRSEWFRSSSIGSPGFTPMWPWSTVQQDLASALVPVLQSRTPLGGATGVWMDELRYEQCRIVMQGYRRSAALFHRDLVADKCSEMLASISPGARMGWRSHAGEIVDSEVEALLDWLSSGAPDDVRRPVPGGDLEGFGRSSWIWGDFSDAGLTEFALEAYGLANQAYDELTSATYSRFGWSLARTADGPLGSLCLVSRGEESQGPGVVHIAMPMPLLDELAKADPTLRWGRSGRAAGKFHSRLDLAERESLRVHFDRMERWRSKYPPQGPFATVSIVTSHLDVGALRPASKIAAKRLFDDLKRIGLGSSREPSIP